MKFAVKALLMGLSVNAVKLEQKSASKTMPYAYTVPYAYNTWHDDYQDYVAPADWGIDRTRMTYSVPECHECEEEVTTDCTEIHDAENAKKAAVRANAVAKHDADVTFEDVKSRDLADIEAAEEAHEDEWEAADAELEAVRKQAAAEVAAAVKANAARKRAADRALAEIKARDEADMENAYRVAVDTKMRDDEVLADALAQADAAIAAAERSAAERKAVEEANAEQKRLFEMRAKEAADKAAADASAARASWEAAKAQENQAAAEADAAEAAAQECWETTCVWAVKKRSRFSWKDSSVAIDILQNEALMWSFRAWNIYLNSLQLKLFNFVQYNYN